MPNSANIISSFCNIYLLDPHRQRMIFRHFIDQCRKSSQSIPDEDIFTGLNSIKLYFYTTMDKSEHGDYIDVCLQYILKRKEFYYQLIETLSVIYKGLDDVLQEKVFDVFVSCFDDLIRSNRGVTTASIFIKNTHKAYSVEQARRMKCVISQLESCCHADLYDTYEYAIINSKRFFSESTNEILLLIPEFQTATSFVQPPLCYLSVGTQLLNAGIPFDILDNRVYSYSIEQLTDIASHYRTIVCTSSPLDQVQTYFLDYRYSIFVKTVNILQSKLSEGQKIIVCGAHSTVRADIVCRDIKPDIILKGEIEIQLFKLLRTLYNRKPIDSFPNILIKVGDFYRTNREDSLEAHPSEWKNLEINYSLVSASDYFGYHFIGNTHVKKLRHAVVQASRGCPFHCIFCYNFYTHSVRYKSIDVLIRELKSISANGFEEFFFIDQTFTINNEYIQALCRSIVENDIALKWTCETRIELIDEPTIKLMKDAGCVGIWFGVESFDENVLNVNKKGYVQSDYTRTISILERYGIDYRAFIMLGMKGDTQASLNKTIDTIIKNKIHISKTIVRCKVRFGTELYDGLSVEQKNSFKSFEALGLYKENLSSLSSKEINEAEQKLMVLNRT